MMRLVTLACVLLLVACGQEDTATPLAAIPELDPAGLEAEVAAHLEEVRGAVATAGPDREQGAEAWYEFARVHHAYGQFRAAREGYRNALLLQPDLVEARYLLGVTENRLHRADAAYTAFLAVAGACASPTIACGVDAATVELALAETAFSLADVDASLGHAQEAVALRPDDAAAWVVLARIEREQGRVTSAIEALERARSLAPEANSFYATLANLYELVGDEARATAVAARRGDRAPLRHDTLQASLEDLKRGSAWAIRQAERAFTSGRFEEAAGFYGEALAVVPDNTTALLGLAAARLRLNEAEAAIEVLGRLLAVEPANAKAWLNLGSAHTLAGNDDAARAALETALERSPNYLLARIQLARLHCAFDRPDAAIAELEWLWAQADDRARYARLAARCLLDHRRFEAAAAWVTRGLAAQPDEIQLLGLQVLIQAAAPEEGLRDGASALATVRALMERLPSLELKHLEALALAESGATEDARAIIDALLRVPAIPLDLREELIVQREAFASGRAWRL
ncbi:tetratricopeptide repeat protein [Wenzhouxiangella marina]|uniref:Uncharacterized protein n=1 Tax=Wenzhouxiangella marina TaxID=1579979 RepID=A0A0K0XV47_9GAMM|nr:tetratricopeptide repeat protein [Wenzhouxiangella marina]AKS41553.1 hypothetical protein WM2015_1179 [Wenzhouxiangella marina]MBB6086688.1 putative Zn-dependent protease [Wenzhouxiangella marina]